MRKISIGNLILALLVPLLVGGTSAAISSKAMLMYGTMNKPALSPPAWVFSVAWTILYIMMGLASYFVIESGADPDRKSIAIAFYVVQLIMNFMWSIVFFNWGMYLLAFIWLIVMWLLVIVCAFRFYSINPISTYLFVPYILWLTFAAYLNMGTYLLNKNGQLR